MPTWRAYSASEGHCDPKKTPSQCESYKQSLLRVVMMLAWVSRQQGTAGCWNERTNVFGRLNIQLSTTCQHSSEGSPNTASCGIGIGGGVSAAASLHLALLL